MPKIPRRVRTELMQGDCLELMKSVPDGSVDMVLTDPPYGIGYKSGAQGVDRRVRIGTGRSEVVRDSYFSTIQNDDSLPTDWIPEVYRVLRDESAIYIYCHWRTFGELQCAVEANGFKTKAMVVIEKSNHGMGDLKGGFAPKHELLLYATKGRHILNFPEKREKDVWHLPVKFSGARRFHPNEKPKSWLEKPIVHSSNPGDTVLDPFMGSGTTGVAAKNLGRNFIGIELDPEYFNIAKTRIENS